MLGSLLVVAGAVGATGVALWLRRDRRYESSESVASAYDAWTEDRLLEQLWGEHVHLGHYGTCLLYTSPSPRDVEESRMPSSA